MFNLYLLNMKLKWIFYILAAWTCREQHLELWVWTGRESYRSDANTNCTTLLHRLQVQKNV